MINRRNQTTDAHRADKKQEKAEREDRNIGYAGLEVQAGFTDDKRAVISLFNNTGVPGVDMRAPLWTGTTVHPTNRSARDEAIDVVTRGLAHLFSGVAPADSQPAVNS